MKGKGTHIAIIGMDCMFPGAPDLASYWKNLKEGVDAIEEVPPNRWDPVYYDPESTDVDRFYCKRGGFIDAHASFRTLDFGVMPVAARGAEPDQLLGLQVAHGALVDAGLEQGEFPRDKTAVILGRGNYIGAGMNRLEQHVRTAEQVVTTLRDLMPDLPESELQRVKDGFREGLGSYGPDTAIGLVPNLCASRIANRLNLQGTAYTVDGACASSLLALDHGVRELVSGRAELALVGGVHLSHDVAFWSVFCQLGALSRAQSIRPFSTEADGILIGEGVGFVVLKREEDARRDGDRIYAVIRGVGISSDGRSASLMNPSSEGQLLALERAWGEAGLEPQTVGMVEAHGTGTPVGDQVELETLQQFFGSGDGRERASLGSVKSMIGHAMPAAGMAGLIKSALALHEKMHLPSLHCESPQPMLEDTMFQVLSEASPWKAGDAGLRRAAVNAFGFGGINAHVVLEENEAASAPSSSVDGRLKEQLLVVSAPDPTTMGQVLRGMKPHTEGLYGEGGQTRLALINPSEERLHKAIALVESGKPRGGRGGIWYAPTSSSNGGDVCFLYPGIEARFQPWIGDACEHFSMPVPPCLEPDTLEEQGVGVVQLGRTLTRMAERCGLRPHVMAGHSVGEWTAMIASGMIEKEAVDDLISGFKANTLQVPGVSFLAIGAGVSRFESRLSDFPDIHLTHDNCPHQSVIVGPEEVILTFKARLEEDRILSQVLPFQSGFHSPLFTPFVEPHKARFSQLPMSKPVVPVWSATHIEPFPEEVQTIRQWSLEHLVETVRFRELISALYEDGARVFVQMGTGSITGFVQDTLKGKPHMAMSMASEVRSGWNQLQRVCAGAFVAGCDIEWSPLWTSQETSPALPLELGVPLVRMEPLLADVTLGAEEVQDVDDPVVASFLNSIQEAEHASREVMRAYRRRMGGNQGTVLNPPETGSSLRLYSVEAFPALLDHTFFRQADGWECLEERYPVVPMTALIEEMRTQVERTIPKSVVSELRQVRARKWMAVEPPIQVETKVEASKTTGEWKVRLGDYTEGIARGAQAYPVSEVSPFPPIENTRAFPLSVQDLYEQRWMFHGPAYQGVVSLDTLGSNGITGTLQTGAAEGALLDNAGQLLGLWVMCTQERDRLAMPVQIESLRFYGPHPAPGTLVRCDIRIRVCKNREVIADMQCWVGEHCWAHIQGWEDWRFETDERLWPLLQFPERHLLAEPLEGDVWTMNLQSRSRRSLDDLSRRFLCREDREQWQAMKAPQKPSWLAGRIAAIDAIRSLLFQEGRTEVFPLEVRVTNEASGRPRATIRGEAEPVYVSIAHKDGKALAQASRRDGVGVDVERIEPRTDAFIQLAFGDKELDYLPAEDREEWITRAWCAKESVGKGQGSGLNFSPKSWVLEGRDGNRLRVNGVWVETRVAEGYGMAWIDEEHS